MYTVVRKGKHVDTPEWHTLHQSQHRHPRHTKNHSITWRQPFPCAKFKQGTRYLCNPNKPPADKRQLETSHYQSVPTNQGLHKVMPIIGGAKDAALSQCTSSNADVSRCGARSESGVATQPAESLGCWARETVANPATMAPDPTLLPLHHHLGLAHHHAKRH